ncbi:hypothetical protein LAUMK7_01586 [Mycobacterium kansasii]|uniref:Uncharacterized protein n=4 Tax=Mycobacterium kansasii TaxID=1768 RepID=A0A653F5A8_MYCKA|nr:hypothetical protein LAUMK22_00959 [Mycobacterium kansasii]VAZ65481.1 hypothetical protein LAUMK40_01606 [Mycobacterium kansasii]VAZ72900.1 hypothetical protein LAUMK7_01586 [Mycobacterium kansasii]VTP04917.1 hypothetical protein BIN_B_04757 [Mycobacterium kansasii]BCI90626.1 hypothetical protein NIIDMKKI_58320 [Mycobacterium kansasii]
MREDGNHLVCNRIRNDVVDSIEVCSYEDAASLASRMRNARPAGSDELWLAGLLAVDGLAALLFAGSPRGNGAGMRWVRSVAALLCDPQYDVSQAIRQAVDGG